MKYIDEHFIALLKKMSESPHMGKTAKEILEKAISYRKTIYTELPRLAKCDLHIIGMVHGGESSQSSEDRAIKSQNRVVELLLQINPEIIGAEGYCGKKYSAIEMIREHLEFMDQPALTATDLNTAAQVLKDDASGNAVFRYKDLHPHTKVFGVEYKELLKLQMHTYYGLARSADDPMHQLFLNMSRIRGILMVAKLGRYLKVRPNSTAALPVGYMHLEEIKELSKEWKAKWRFHNATDFKDIDLPP